MKQLTTFILTKIGLAVSGPIGWVASLIIDKLLGVIITLLFQAAQSVKDKVVENQNKKEEAKAETKYEGTLQDGASEADQVEASTDVLNSGSRHR
jgi:hypothetical protein